ncbi:hypothetical protein EVG20_g1019 [Dentipellis fragilis]|uniref:20S-pre-rRNA D-site endonuclease NOB1 n=1 Tax=Dentipellis fragilis TaxID=205917 RepID=A0A4Y9ZBM9_9AGAM|nr:hypothetical protein EVG20_g1019 [Dentipellis fragilis]
MTTSSPKPACKQLVLDAGPLLSLSPLRGLAETYVTVPQVLDELKDSRAREHFEKLGVSAGVKVQVQSPDAASLAHVIQFAKKTGDYSVLSHADLCVIALTYALETQYKKQNPVPSSGEPSSSDAPFVQDDQNPAATGAATPAAETSHKAEQTAEEQGSDPREAVADEEAEPIIEGEGQEDDMEDREPLDVELRPVEESAQAEVTNDSNDGPSPAEPSSSSKTPPVYEDPSDEDDGEGEWITPSNVALHKSRALGLTPSASAAAKGKAKEIIPVGCMTADFAMQNVLLQMGLSLVGVEGKKIDKVKTWVLRCHACFKICKDPSKKFCPSCGNPTLLRASVTLSAPGASTDAPVMQIHLKKNFQYKNRGTIYSIPAAKPGSAKTGNGDGLILREDQTEYMRAQKRVDAKRQRDEKKMLNSAIANGGNGVLSVGNWMDPDWIPEIISAGPSGKGRKSKGGDSMPTIGYGRKNPNERKHHK